MPAKARPDPDGQFKSFERLKSYTSLLIALEQALLAALQLIRLIGC
jgi:hypothetical protein